MSRTIAKLLVVAAVTSAATASAHAQVLSQQELARPAHFARRQMLAQQAARERQRPARLDTMPLKLSAASAAALIERVGRDSANRMFFGDSLRSTLCGLRDACLVRLRT